MPRWYVTQCPGLGQYRHARPGIVVTPRWLRVSRDYPRATSHAGAWCRADGEGSPSRRWLGRSHAHLEHHWSLRRRGVYDTRWTVLTAGHSVAPSHEAT